MSDVILLLQAGSLLLTSYWMWAAEGGSGGSIQDGDTEGQITWDGTEWTPDSSLTIDSLAMRILMALVQIKAAEQTLLPH